MQQLSAATVRLLSSAQVITAVVSVVKELLENALDASATNIEVKLENFGFDKIEVRDNGTGIEAADAPVMGIRHYTSKISSHEDLERLRTYGFRGEALGSICSIAEVHIATKTATDPISTQYVLDHDGRVVLQKPSHLGQGTTVSVMRLFKNLPVRKQYYSTAKKCRDELRKVQDLLTAYGLIRPDVRIVLAHNKISIDGYLPRPEADSALTSVHGPEKSFIFINQRPVLHKDILKMVRLHYNQNKDSARCYPIFFMCIRVPASSVDVNLTPDKTQVLLHNKEFILEAVENVLKSVYPDQGTIAICKPGAESKDINTKCIESPSADQHKNSNMENKESEKLNVSLSPENKNYGGRENQSQGSSSHDHSMPSDLEEVDGKEYFEAHTSSSSSDQGNQKDLMGNQEGDGLCSSAVTQTPELKGFENTAFGDDPAITDEAWSRGNAFRTSTGEDIQPVMVLCPSAVSLGGEEANETALDKSQSENTEQKTTNKITEKSGFVTAYDLINSRVIKKPVSAVDIFTQESRTAVLGDSPHLAFEEIPSVIKDMWEKLSEEEKLRYEEKAAKDLARYETQTAKAAGGTMQKARETGKKLKLMLNKSPAQKSKLKAPMSNQQILDKLFHSQVEKKSALLPAIKTVTVDFSLSNLRQQLYKPRRKETTGVGATTLINKLNVPGAWVVASKNGIALLNPYRVEEALLYKRLVENHKLPVEKLDAPIILNERLLGGPECFTALLSMQQDSPRPNGQIYFSDAKLTYNGFQIKMIPGFSKFADHVEIDSLATSLPFYGISDLKEVLGSVMKGKSTLCECRPLKVLNYLEGEAVRLARQLPLNLSKRDVLDTMRRMETQLSGNQKECIHGRPFFHQLSDITGSDD
ncbi:PMS1 protein homolog 1 isoform X2 [Eleutherodactylus coqui]|uniref:PMS1 protein homolog 1 isoform X2 n=1 Tax=Eleutherodactylus coqui TaxID=57060 RepID=UPI003462CDE6